MQDTITIHQIIAGDLFPRYSAITGAPFAEMKDAIKAAGGRFDGSKKSWLVQKTAVDALAAQGWAFSPVSPVDADNSAFRAALNAGFRVHHSPDGAHFGVAFSLAVGEPTRAHAGIPIEVRVQGVTQAQTIDSRDARPFEAALARFVASVVVPRLQTEFGTVWRAKGVRDETRFEAALAAMTRVFEANWADGQQFELPKQEVHHGYGDA